MTDQERWEQRNEAYLAAALQWLRLRLYRLGGPVDAAAEAPPEKSPGRGGLFRRRVQPRALLAAGEAASPEDAEIEDAAAAMADAEGEDPPPAMSLLARRFGLSRFEQECLLLCTALELDTRIADLCAHAQRDPARPYPTFALMTALFDDPAWEVLSPERPLRYWRLIEINQPGAEPLTTSALRADERIVNFVKGLNYLDDRLAPLLGRFDTRATAPLPPSQQTVARTIEHILERSRGDGPPPLIQLVGVDPLSKQLVAQQAAAGLGLNLYRMPAELLPAQPAELETLARLWQRESLLLPTALFLDAHEVEGEGKGDGAPERAGALPRFLARSRGIFLLSTREARPGLHPAVRVFEVDRPAPEEQRAAWSAVLGTGGEETAARLAGQFNLNTTTIDEIVRSLEGSPDEEALWSACLARTSPQLERLAQRLHPVATWDDIVLPEGELHLLRQVADQVARRTTVYDDWGFRARMNRGLGISALFAGESGTGKTMAAEVIANHLRLELYRIDLSAVVSKYIGETEKNLRRLFDAAEDGGAILFFDEADALFGKRSEVRDSHDRYANIEINYLLQRMESYRGLAVLATNMKSALDQAFMRRLRFIVTFPFPGRAQREAIWRRAWPEATPVGAIDFAHLARFNLTGGSIANVALNAAFMAADRGGAVTMPRVLDAVRTEFRKLERPYDEAELAWSEPEPGGDPEDAPSPAPAADREEAVA